MASIKIVASKLLTTRSVVRPAAAASGFLHNNNNIGVGLHTTSIVRPAAASGFLNNNIGVGHLLHGPVFANRARGHATLPLYDGFINSFQTATRKLRRLYKRMTYSTTERVYPSWKYSNREYLQLYIHMRVTPALYHKILVFVDHRTIFIQGYAPLEYIFTGNDCNKYVCWIDLPDIDASRKTYKVSDIKAEMIDGEIRLTIPKYKPEETTFNVKVDTIE